MHTIRLRGPWQIEPMQRFVLQPDSSYARLADQLPPPAEAKMPADWGGAFGDNFWGVVRYRRNFNRPTNLGSRDRVWLVVEPPRSCGLVRVNGNELGYVRFGASPCRFDITPLLADHNSVEIDVEHPALDDNGNPPGDGGMFVTGGLVGEVRLEIEE